MISHQNEQQLKAHPYLINPKSRIENLQSLFGPGTMDTESHKQLSFILEVSLYVLFGSFIFIMMLLPTSASGIQNLFPNTPLVDPVGSMLWIKMTLFIASLVPLFWALHQSSKRLKGRLFLRRIKR
jgi:hypothetical protein